MTLIFLNFTRQAYLHVQLGTIALDSARHNKAADHFTAAVYAAMSSISAKVHDIYGDLVVVR